MNKFLLELLHCPRHMKNLNIEKSILVCAKGCRFPVVNGIPVMLLSEMQQTMDLANTSLKLAQVNSENDGLYVDSLGLNEEQKILVLKHSKKKPEIDPVVSFIVGATNGIAYKNQIGDLRKYPIPEIRLPPGGGKLFLDLGCNWGRWCIAAARKNYIVIGIDPSLGAVMAAKRVADKIGVEASFIVGDARFLPIRTATIDQIFSYSVIQHLSQDDASKVLSEVGRSLEFGGKSFIQMPTKHGLRCLYHQMRRGFRVAKEFEVRYWTQRCLRDVFTKKIGRTSISTDCYFGIGLQMSDLKLMTPALKVIVLASECIRFLSKIFPPLVWVADSVYLDSQKESEFAHK
jgi:SAM-dependent methyltransferase/uncharacterized protein YbaR (Trm112 family)